MVSKIEINKQIEILKFLETITTDKIIISDHFIIRNVEEHINDTYNDTELYKKLLTKNNPVEVSLQPNNKVRIKYEHPYSIHNDFCIVFVRKNDNIKLITTFNTPITKGAGRSKYG